MHRALPIKGFKIRVGGGEKSSKGLETYTPSSAALLERSTLSLPAQEDISGSRSTWRVEGLDQTVQLKACDQYKNLEKEKLFCRKGFIWISWSCGVFLGFSHQTWRHARWPRLWDIWEGWALLELMPAESHNPTSGLWASAPEHHCRAPSQNDRSQTSFQNPLFNTCCTIIAAPPGGWGHEGKMTGGKSQVNCVQGHAKWIMSSLFLGHVPSWVLLFQ